MPSSHLILCRPLLLLPPISPSIRVFSNESTLRMRCQSTGVSASASVLPMNTQDGSPLGWTGWISFQSKGLSSVFSNTMMPKTCLSRPHSPARVLGVPALVSPDQRSSSCSPPSLQLGRPGASGVCLCSLPSHIRGGSYTGLIPVATGTIQSGPPSSHSVRSWSAWQVQLGRRPHGSSRDRASSSCGRLWDWIEMPAPGRVSSQQITEQPHSASDSPCPLSYTGLLSLTSETSCSTEKRKV